MRQNNMATTSCTDSAREARSARGHTASGSIGRRRGCSRCPMPATRRQAAQLEDRADGASIPFGIHGSSVRKIHMNQCLKAQPTPPLYLCHPDPGGRRCGRTRGPRSHCSPTCCSWPVAGPRPLAGLPGWPRTHLALHVLPALHVVGRGPAPLRLLQQAPVGKSPNRFYTGVGDRQRHRGGSGWLAKEPTPDVDMRKA